MEHLRYRYGSPLSQFLADVSTLNARYKLRGSGPLSILIDNTVLAHAITHETAWISTGPQKWGNEVIDTGYAARISVHPAVSEDRSYGDIRFLPGLVALAKRNYIRLKTSAELRAEQFRQPSGRFRGYGYFDLNLFGSVSLDSVDGIVFPQMGPTWMKLPSGKEQQLTRLAQYEAVDPDYASLVDVLGRRNSQDAWHIRTAEKHRLFCFLTMDYGLLEIIKAQTGARRIKALKTRIMSPTDLGIYLGLRAIDPQILSYINASFPVRGDISWPNGRRRGRS
jgi:hypothetical protein